MVSLALSAVIKIPGVIFDPEHSFETLLGLLFFT